MMVTLQATEVIGSNGVFSQSAHEVFDLKAVRF